jgi:hypothetical protein
VTIAGLRCPVFPWICSSQAKTQNYCAIFGCFCFYTLIKMNFERQDYADAFSLGFVHRKLKPKLLRSLRVFLFLYAYQNEF